MSTKTKTTPAAKTAAPATTAAPKAEPKPKAKREVLNLGDRFKAMEFVKTHYADKRMTDTDFAKAATEQLGFKVSAAAIKNYREAFGIAQVKAATPAELRARIAELEAELAKAKAGDTSKTPQPEAAG